MPDLEDRVAELEAVVRSLQDRLAVADGEALFAGQIAPLALHVLIAQGLLPAATAREALDRFLLLLEQKEGVAGPQAAALEHARSRAEATLRPLLGSRPG